MPLKYQSGEGIRKGDRIIFHGEPGRIEFVANDPGDPEAGWFTQKYGGGIMILEGVAGYTFVPLDQVEECEDLEFVSRADTPPEKSG